MMLQQRHLHLSRSRKRPRRASPRTSKSTRSSELGSLSSLLPFSTRQRQRKQKTPSREPTRFFPSPAFDPLSPHLPPPRLSPSRRRRRRPRQELELHAAGSTRGRRLPTLVPAASTSLEPRSPALRPSFRSRQRLSNDSPSSRSRRGRFPTRRAQQTLCSCSLCRRRHHRQPLLLAFLLLSLLDEQRTSRPGGGTAASLLLPLRRREAKGRERERAKANVMIEKEKKAHTFVSSLIQAQNYIKKTKGKNKLFSTFLFPRPNDERSRPRRSEPRVVRRPPRWRVLRSRKSSSSSGR